ncbi:hypothetical protein F441_02409 [Phytophthora nicotianae CJ01A1]|uniref:Uncharacterized protein n=2 Tax=Phytophthora nicotianae TaxID=4792 RepID=W2HJ95_PHYNI|nr:hypothetical protein L915_02342 [Phytophthora nicotianae]ETL48046.1 hypothetical protein L916_02300 [Phytophthora nicotianae]ETM01141.1 hypothetical protein L917_02232 [Phytophthora nicotianae]ETM54318.1 hypothetical protein L914_02330 [Phytophthora nicotianae]ETP24626.1 hypothetical protein F441_02409 [Phytophthora nicotianae CJ01A1]
MMPGSIFSKEMISREKAYTGNVSKLVNELPENRVHEIHCDAGMFAHGFVVLIVEFRLLAQLPYIVLQNHEEHEEFETRDQL